MLILEAALVANFAGTSNTAGLQAAVAMIFIYIVFYEVALDGTQFVYLGELFPSHLRAKGVSLGVAGICIMNVLWLQVAPTAFAYVLSLLRYMPHSFPSSAPNVFKAILDGSSTSASSSLAPSLLLAYGYTSLTRGAFH